MPKKIEINSVLYLPSPRTYIKDIRKAFIHLYKIWIENQFGVGETVGDDTAWVLMSDISATLVREDNPTITFQELDVISNDYERLTSLFFYRELNLQSVDLLNYNFFANGFKAAEIIDLYRMDPLSIISESSK